MFHATRLTPLRPSYYSPTYANLNDILQRHILFPLNVIYERLFICRVLIPILDLTLHTTDQFLTKWYTILD